MAVAVNTPYEKSRKKRFLILFVLIFMLTLAIPVFAADFSYGDKSWDKVSKSGTLAMQMLVDISDPTADTETAGSSAASGSDSIAQMTGMDIDISNPASPKITSICGQDISGSDFGGIVSGIFKGLQSGALALLVATFCISFMRAYLEGGAGNYEEIIVRQFCIFGLSIVMINFVGTLTLGFAGLGTSLTNGVMGKIGSAGGAGTVKEGLSAGLDVIANECSTAQGHSLRHPIKTTMDALTGFGYILQLGLPWLLCKLSWILIQVTCWARALEIIIVAALSPLSVVDFTGRSLFDRFGGYIRTVLVLTFQGVVILLVLKLGQMLQGAVAVGSLVSGGKISPKTLVGMVVLCVVQVSMVGRSRDIARSIFG